MINVIGLGVGNLDYFSEAGKKLLKTSEIIIGGKRQLEDIEILLNSNIEKYYLSKLDDMKMYIDKNINKEVSIIVSGDTGYYSLLSFIKKNFSENLIRVIPGISSFQYLFGKLCDTWEDYSLCSLHGRDLDIIEILKNSKKGVILLTDKKNNPYIIGKKLLENKIENIEIIVGENLSYDDEKISRFFLSDIEKYNREFSINVMVIKKCI
ncbi:MAG: precorrin-6y C5,15-methyltransferase (decarboxylating) subunit CbiE [Fusobacterium perfoetens]|uniref:precorrin-6y C5,15-methyltransferase (decarboxylating) subunit CbiE n=1 Tax=Fusobacterium perfoetens TaxID=852 RepID=UPI0023F15B2F|nr:precorrin-6y C5,15-methyltransferase (decarboxylating) subunit CbiE [Fusobacterium perfoetens]MCI6151669.1 precorrin-6y C5,15-methyltransferase (decarboxylating) subunit CbiE [Fusobacterium perfoetens]MDY3236575.1 precorrin-6y C5,15-methyltransferase (decarboxylating) subunit CbiE [Fusobacterium perfoetens]